MNSSNNNIQKYNSNIQNINKDNNNNDNMVRRSHVYYNNR